MNLYIILPSIVFAVLMIALVLAMGFWSYDLSNTHGRAANTIDRFGIGGFKSDVDLSISSGLFEGVIKVNRFTPRYSVKFLWPRLFFSKAEKIKIVKAIDSAEKLTSCELKLHLARKLTDNPDEYTKKLFKRLKLKRTKEHNACLIAIGLVDGAVAIYSDFNVRLEVEHGFFKEVVEKIISSFENNNNVQGIVESILLLGSKLSKIHPAENKENEISNSISF